MRVRGHGETPVSVRDAYPRGDEKGRWGQPAGPGSAASCYPRTPAKRE